MYVLDVAINWKCNKELTTHMSVVRNHIKEGDLRMELTKCVCEDARVEVPGWIVSEHSIASDLKNIKCISEVGLPYSNNGCIFCFLFQQMIPVPVTTYCSLLHEITTYNQSLCWVMMSKLLFVPWNISWARHDFGFSRSTKDVSRLHVWFKGHPTRYTAKQWYTNYSHRVLRND